MPVKQFVGLLTPCRPSLLHDATEAEHAMLEKHFDYVKTLTAKGTVILAGPCLDGHLGIVVFEAPDEESARELMKTDPAVQAGVFTAHVHPFRVSLLRGR